MTEIKYEGTLTKVKEVKHSVVYKNDKLAGIYIPKEILLPTPFPATIKITLEVEV